MKILIVCDGTTTRVFDSASGEQIDNVRKVTFSHEAGSSPIATIEVLCSEIDVTDVTAQVAQTTRKELQNAKENRHPER